jgi:hypothetical protein
MVLQFFYGVCVFSGKEFPMKKSISIAVSLALIIAVIPAAASTPQNITIESVMDLNTSTGTFVATGPAVDDGLFCPSGDVYDLDAKPAGWQSGILVNLRVDKKFVCADGSGEIYFDLKVHIFRGVAVSNWVIEDGNGDYARLNGTGKITADGADNIVYDHYTGKVHQD